MEPLGTQWTDFHEILCWVFFENPPRKFKFHYSLARIVGTLNKHLCIYMIITRWILPRMRNVSGKSCRENKNTHFTSKILFSRKLCHLWDNVGKYGSVGKATDNNIIWRMRTASWTTMATDTHSQYVIFISLPRQPSLRERVSMLCLYEHCLS